MKRFGRFEIIRNLGRGMADVYLAFEPEAGRQVVLKVIEKSKDRATQLAIEAEGRGARIQRELSKFDGRILKIHEIGERNGCFFVAMEYFPGRTVANILQSQGPLDPHLVARFGMEICGQLQAIHQLAVVHGDIKPSNIQVGDEDGIRLLDFGIAKVISAGHDLTRLDLGSPSYCSPERLRKSQVDAQADLWSLGVTLYEMLAGAPPFQAGDTGKLERLIASGNPPPALPDSCPRELKKVVTKALAKDLNRRYTSAAAFEADLRRFIERPRADPTLLRASPERPAQGWTNVLIALLAGVLTGLILFIPLAHWMRLSGMSRELAGRKNYLALAPSALARDWQMYQSLKRDHLWTLAAPDTEWKDRFRQNLVESAHHGLYHLDYRHWSRGRLCLLYASAIEPLDSAAKAELHLFYRRPRLLTLSQ